MKRDHKWQTELIIMIETKIVEFRLMLFYCSFYILLICVKCFYSVSLNFSYFISLFFTFRKILIDESIVKISEKNNKCFFIFQRKVYVQFCLPYNFVSIENNLLIVLNKI